MLFNSFQFLVFFTTLFFVYFACPHRWRWVLLLLASYYFYMCWRVEYIVLILVSTGIDYFCGIHIENAETKWKRKSFLIISLVANLGLLFFFKYYNFFSTSINTTFQHYNLFYKMPYFSVLLPVGISFYTFQTLSYTIDVYQKKRGAERHLGIFALYVAFFPQLVAGPIERSTHLMPQFRNRVQFDYDRVVSGLRLVLWGYIKKCVVADRLAWYVEGPYLRPESASALELGTATLFFAFQIYCDFSAYSDIAIGVARMMGFDLMQNFRQPYLARSITDFWRRWHISLSTWFRDYVYIPLGGNRVSKWRCYYNLVIVFLLSGLWHGANWTFVFWGALHAFYLVVSLTIGRFVIDWFTNLCGSRKGMQSIGRILAVAGTFAVVLYAWVYFRAASVGDAWIITQRFILGISQMSSLSVSAIWNHIYEFKAGLFLVALIWCAQILQSKLKLQDLLSKQPLLVRWGLYYAGIFAVLFFGVLENDQFIYFQF